MMRTDLSYRKEQQHLLHRTSQHQTTIRTETRGHGQSVPAQQSVLQSAVLTWAIPQYLRNGDSSSAPPPPPPAFAGAARAAALFADIALVHSPDGLRGRVARIAVCVRRGEYRLQMTETEDAQQEDEMLCRAPNAPLDRACLSRPAKAISDWALVLASA